MKLAPHVYYLIDQGVHEPYYPVSTWQICMNHPNLTAFYPEFESIVNDSSPTDTKAFVESMT